MDGLCDVDWNEPAAEMAEVRAVLLSEGERTVRSETRVGEQSTEIEFEMVMKRKESGRKQSSIT